MSSLSDFESLTRNIRIRLRADLDRNSVYEDYTNFLNNYTVYQSLSGDNITGLYETILDAELNIPNPSIDWAKPGIPIIADVQISDDNWATQFTATTFTGSTERQNSIPISQVNIRASSLNSNFLDKKVARQVFTNTDAHTIIDTLLTQAGVPAPQKSITTSGIIIPVYYVSASKTVREIITDILNGLLAVAGFDIDGVFRIRSISPLVFGTNGTTPDVITTQSTQFAFKQQNVSSRYYCNTIKVSGKQKVYLDTTPFGMAPQIYFNNILQGLEIKPNSKLYYAVDMPDIEPELFLDFVRVGLIFPPSTRSRFGFYTTDDGSGVLDTTSVQLVSASIAYDDDKKKDTIFLVFVNQSSTTSFWLKLLNIFGKAVQTTGTVIDERQDASLLQSDGVEIKKEITSDAIFDDVRASTVANILQLNNMQYADVYQFEIRGRPEVRIGSRLRFKDRANNDVFSVVTEYDTECSIDKGYMTLITAKRLNTNLQFFGFDDSNSGLDDNTLQLL